MVNQEGRPRPCGHCCGSRGKFTIIIKMFWGLKAQAFKQQTLPT